MVQGAFRKDFMKTPKWTKADSKRAEKMGWQLKEVRYECANCGPYNTASIERLSPYGTSKHKGRFKSDDEAIEWVVAMVISGYFGSGEIAFKAKALKTCRKALLLCAKG